LEQRFAEALSGMSYDNPSHRAVLEAEGLRRWEPPHLEGYDSLRQACTRQGFLQPPDAEVDRAMKHSSDLSPPDVTRN
jgi:hypothetical protein